VLNLGQIGTEFTRSDLADVQFEIFSGPDIAHQSPSLYPFLEYFQDKAGPRKMAARADLRPEQIKPYLSRFVMFDLMLDDAGHLQDIRGRILGAKIIDFYGNFTNRSLKENTNKRAVARVFRAVEQMVEQKSAVLTVAQGSVTGLKSFMVNSLYIPLSDDDDRPNYLAGAVEFVPVAGE